MSRTQKRSHTKRPTVGKLRRKGYSEGRRGFVLENSPESALTGWFKEPDRWWTVFVKRHNHAIDKRKRG